jgi:hypothetical protein
MRVSLGYAHAREIPTIVVSRLDVLRAVRLAGHDGSIDFGTLKTRDGESDPVGIGKRDWNTREIGTTTLERVTAENDERDNAGQRLTRQRQVLRKKSLLFYPDARPGKSS